MSSPIWWVIGFSLLSAPVVFGMGTAAGGLSLTAGFVCLLVGWMAAN